MQAVRTCAECDAPAAAGRTLCRNCETAKRPIAAKDSPKRSGFEQIPGGRYEIISRLGTGASGSVYQAQDAFLNRPVAVKSIRLDTTLDPEHRKALNKRFIREAQVAAQLHHPNIVTIYDIIFTPDTGFIVMEFIEGRTLHSILKQQRIPLATAVEIAIQIGSALQYAHEHKVIHRDVKPANVMITPRNEARIMDFGIAKSDGATHLTMSGSLVGTPDYMSPEQAKGEDVDARTDIFSLGCVIYECAVGEKPFKGGSLTGVLLSIVNTDPLESKAWRLHNHSHELEAILMRALAKDPQQRFETAAALVAALRKVELAEGAPADAVVNLPGRDPQAATPLDSRTVIIDPDDAAHSREAIEERLKSFKGERRPLKFAATLSDELQDISLTPAQGFILSRIDGASLARDILALSPLPETEVAETIADLIEKGLLAWGDVESIHGVEQKSSDVTKRRGAKAKPAALDRELEREMERILELGGETRYLDLFGVSENAAPQDVKKSYLDIIERFHPDSQPGNIDAEARQKLSKVCALATEALTALSPKEPPKTTAPPPAPSQKTAPAPSLTRTGDAKFDRSRYAEELFRLAERAYEMTDYWEAIQLSRQAIELDAGHAPYHHLLGLGLMKNRNWLKEAEECFRKAAELDPTNAEYFNLLATVYKAEGLSERSQSMLEKAKSLGAGYC